MKSKKFRIIIPALQAYIYTILYNAGVQTKNLIPPRLLKFVKNHREAKKWIDNSNLDEKLAVLASLNVRWFLVLVKDEAAGIDDLRQLMTKFKEDKKILSLKDIVDLQLFVTSDKEFTYLLGLMAQVIHTLPYKNLLDLSRSGYKQWPSQPGNGSSGDVEVTEFLNRTTLNSPLILKRSEFLFNLRELQMLILLYLYPLKHTYVPTEKIKSFLAGQFNPTQVSGALRDLLRSEHAQRNVEKEKHVTITALGIRVVNQFHEAVIRANTFL